MIKAGYDSAARPTISVVTPSFNMEPYLTQTIESVLMNLRPGDEYFIIDGASTDGSLDVIRHYAARLTGWVSEPDHGYADALAKGFARASGDLLCWINAGDMLLRGALDQARGLFSTATDLIWGDDFYVDETGKTLGFSRGRVGSLGDAMLYGGWTPLQDACFWRRSLYQRVGGIDTSLRYAADYDLFLRMSLHGRCRYVSVAFSAFRRHPGQKSISGAESYAQERETCRRRELSTLTHASLRRKFYLAYYWIYVRFRARVSQVFWGWKARRLVGLPVGSLASEPYWEKC